MKRFFLPIAKTSLVLVYCVIVAGALVRMTGSGMGCPDWPKCFGYYIPPTDIEQLTWRAGKTFEKGQVIIKDEALWVTNEDFTAGKVYDASKFREYTKHDYAIFNPKHTWIEYINRLCGALAGVFVFAMAILSFWMRRHRKSIVWLSWLTVFLMGFQAWLGATVVYSVLNPIKITVHMVVALVIVAIILQIIWSAKTEFIVKKRDSLFGTLVAFSLVLTLAQIVLGTQVRQFVDEQVKTVGYDNMEMVLNNPTISFYVHRSFSILVFLVNLLLFLRNRKLGLGFGKMNWVFGLIAAEIVSGIAMAYFDFPFGSQTTHLVLASILFGVQFYMVMEFRNLRKRRESVQ